MGCVWLLIRQSIWNWPVAIANAVFYAIVFFNAKLYADMGLQFFFLGINVYGWIVWRKESVEHKLSLSHTHLSEVVTLFFIGIVSVYGIGRFLSLFTDSPVPFLDATISTMSILAQYMQARKRIENWFVWIIVNIISIGVYYLRDLHFTMVLYMIFLVMAIVGYREWRKNYIPVDRA